MSTTTKKIDVNWEEYNVHVVHLSQDPQGQPIVESYRLPSNTLMILRGYENFIEDFNGERLEVPSYGEEYVLIESDNDGDITLTVFDELEELNEYLKQHYNIELTEVSNNEV